MATAANMQCAVLARADYAELVVSVAATAGVLGNATRAGDPAGWHEHPDGSRRVAPPRVRWIMSPLPEQTAPRGWLRHHRHPGLHQSALYPACLVRAATLVTEGKSAAVLDLRMPSLQSAGLATGTGTDQLAIAAPLARGDEWERHWAGSHNTLGELLGRATHEAVTRCLLLQNGVCAELRRTICAALGRHGCDESTLARWRPYRTRRCRRPRCFERTCSPSSMIRRARPRPMVWPRSWIWRDRRAACRGRP